MKRQAPIHRSPVDRISYRFRQFAHIEGVSGMLLVGATLLALVWANSPWSASYFALIHLPIRLDVGNFTLNEPLVLWINDALMAVFFFVVGLELKREILIGELSSFRKAILPALAAVGGMVFPVFIFWSLNRTHPAALEGWAIPMATDIAFAVGVLSLVGRRVPLSLVVFLTALAIVDDIGAILVIAMVYTEQIHWTMLLIGLALVGVLALYARLGGRWVILYLALGGGVWLAIFLSGVHATIAGVLVALTIPVRTKMDVRDFSDWIHHLLDRFDADIGDEDQMIPTRAQRAVLTEISQAVELVDSPLHRLEHLLHPWVAFLVMPAFALANAGVFVNSSLLRALFSPLTLGIFLGLVVGKPLGVSLATWVGVRLKLGKLPEGVVWRHILGAGVLAGMGFTMSIFITTLAFSEGGGHVYRWGGKLASAVWATVDPATMADLSKLAILIASTVAGVVGYLLLRRAPTSVADEDWLAMPPSDRKS